MREGGIRAHDGASGVRIYKGSLFRKANRSKITA
jgi:hypothetical protein